MPTPAAIASRGELNATGATVEQDLAAVGTVQAGKDVHERALAGAVLAQHGMDLADAQVEGNPVVGEDAREGLDDPARLQGVRRAASAATGARGSVTVTEGRCRVRRWETGGPRILSTGERRQLDGDPVGPPVHARRALVAGCAGRELVEVGLLELRAFGQDLLAGVVGDRSGERVEPVPLTGEHLGQRVTHHLDVGFRQVGDALAERLAVHEAEQAHRLRIRRRSTRSRPCTYRP